MTNRKPVISLKMQRQVAQRSEPSAYSLLYVKRVGNCISMHYHLSVLTNNNPLELVTQASIVHTIVGHHSNTP